MGDLATRIERLEAITYGRYTIKLWFPYWKEIDSLKRGKIHFETNMNGLRIIDEEGKVVTLDGFGGVVAKKDITFNYEDIFGKSWRPGYYVRITGYECDNYVIVNVQHSMKTSGSTKIIPI